MVQHITKCMESIRLLATRTISSRQTYLFDWSIDARSIVSLTVSSLVCTLVN